MLCVAVLFSAASVGLMSVVQTPPQALLLYGVLFGIGSAGTSITPIGVLLTRWYPDRAGLANSAAIAGMGVGQLVVVALLAAQLGSIGWRGAFRFGIGTTSSA